MVCVKLPAKRPQWLESGHLVFYAAMVIHLAATLLALAAPQLDEPWLTFSESKALSRRVTKVEVGTFRSDTGERHFWFRRTVRQGRAAQIWFADTIRCPAARRVVNAVRTVTPPQISLPGDPFPGDEVIITADGATYVVEAEARYGNRVGSDISFSSNVGTPLAMWVDESLLTLEPCWSREPPASR